MTLADWQLRALGPTLISPYIEENVQPASIDVRLGNDFMVFERDQTPFIDLADPVDITKRVHVEDGDYFMLHPGEFVLGVTMERVMMPNNIVCRIEGRSSCGRLGLMVHVTAGYIDPGFCGPITLEMTCMHPLPMKLRPGFRVAQLSFVQIEEVENPYVGRYQDADTVQASRFGDDRRQTQVPYVTSTGRTCAPVPRRPAKMENLEGDQK